MNETQIRLFNQSKICFRKLQYLSSINDCLCKDVNLQTLRIEIYQFMCMKLNNVNDLLYCSKTLDSSISFFDLYLKEIIEDSKNLNVNININHYKKHLIDVSQVCMIMSIKLFETHSFDIIKSHFNNCYGNNTFISLEYEILIKVGGKLCVMCIPTSFVDLLIQLIPKDMIIDPTLITTIREQTYTLIRQFRGTIHGLRYSAVTIAISALLLLFSNYNIDMARWLGFIPDLCLASASPTALSNNNRSSSSSSSRSISSYLDADSCILVMQEELNRMMREDGYPMVEEVQDEGEGEGREGKRKLVTESDSDSNKPSKSTRVESPTGVANVDTFHTSPVSTTETVPLSFQPI